MPQTKLTSTIRANSQFLTTTATYKEGVILPRIKPTYPVGEIIVVYIPAQTRQPRTDSIEKMKKEDEQIWQKIEPQYRKIRAKLSKQKFPSLYA